MLSDTQNNPLSLSVAKPNTFSRHSGHILLHKGLLCSCVAAAGQSKDSKMFDEHESFTHKEPACTFVTQVFFLKTKQNTGILL